MFVEEGNASKGKYQLLLWLQMTNLLEEKRNLSQGCGQLTGSKEMLKALALKRTEI